MAFDTLKGETRDDDGWTTSNVVVGYMRFSGFTLSLTSLYTILIKPRRTSEPRRGRSERAYCFLFFLTLNRTRGTVAAARC